MVASKACHLTDTLTTNQISSFGSGLQAAPIQHSSVTNTWSLFGKLGRPHVEVFQLASQHESLLDHRQAAPPRTTTQSALRLMRAGTRDDAPSTDFMPLLSADLVRDALLVEDVMALAMMLPSTTGSYLPDKQCPNLCTKALPRWPCWLLQWFGRNTMPASSTGSSPLSTDYFRRSEHRPCFGPEREHLDSVLSAHQPGMFTN
jgi:hypothetical protein